jgi:hypothetical protein
MKSIKEKAEEHLNSVYYGYDNVLKTLVKEGYEAGANYVLECIEEATNICFDEELRKVIEQLKK